MDMTTHTARVRIQVRYIEMPRLRLAPPQIAKLCDVPEHLCEDALERLVWSGFLTRTPDGAFVRSGVRATD